MCFRNIFLKYSVENNGNDDDIRKSVRKDINIKKKKKYFYNGNVGLR